jgi:hypothetical protein
VADDVVSGALGESGHRDFDFLIGEWRVEHRRVDALTGMWTTFDGTASNAPVMNGLANVEQHVLMAPHGRYRAVALRSYDAASNQWAIWWFDERHPASPIDPAERGGFAEGVGTFYSHHTNDGKPMTVRFRWSNITTTGAQWEQSVSHDGGASWAPNYHMTFHREHAPQPRTPAPRSDFAFLDGTWRMSHGFLRSLDAPAEWLETDGTATHRELLDGVANIDEYVVHAPRGRYEALAVRLWDRRAQQWSIWWLDGRQPHAPVDPPFRGGFTDDGTGTFFGETTVGDQRFPARFRWTRGGSSAPQWEQAISADDGRTWQPNWTMRFEPAHGFS